MLFTKVCHTSSTMVVSVGRRVLIVTNTGLVWNVTNSGRVWNVTSTSRVWVVTKHAHVR